MKCNSIQFKASIINRGNLQIWWHLIAFDAVSCLPFAEKKKHNKNHRKRIATSIIPWTTATSLALSLSLRFSIEFMEIKLNPVYLRVVFFLSSSFYSAFNWFYCTLNNNCSNGALWISHFWLFCIIYRERRSADVFIGLHSFNLIKYFVHPCFDARCETRVNNPYFMIFTLITFRFVFVSVFLFAANPEIWFFATNQKKFQSNYWIA